MNETQRKREWRWYGGEGFEGMERKKIVACAWLSWTKFRVNAFWPIFWQLSLTVCMVFAGLWKKHRCCCFAAAMFYIFVFTSFVSYIEMTWKPLVYTRFEMVRHAKRQCVCINLVAVGNLCFSYTHFSFISLLQNMTFTDDGWSRASIFLATDSFVCNRIILLSLSLSFLPSPNHHHRRHQLNQSRNTLTYSLW